MKTNENSTMPPLFAAWSKTARAAVLFAFAFALAFVGGVAKAEDGKVRAAASIAPLHSLLAGVMDNVGDAPLLLIDADKSPHRPQLAPSKVRALHNADIFFYIGGGGEGFGERLIHSLKGEKVAFTETIELLPFRRPNFLSRRGGHDHDDHGDDHKHRHDKHDDDNHDDDHKHRHDKHDDHDGKHGKHKDKHGHDNEHDDDHGKHEKHDDHDDNHGRKHRHHHGTHDVHLWLDIDRARQIVKQMADALGKQYPSQRDAFQQNAKTMDAKLAALDKELAATLAAAQNQPFAVAHDAYQYFERKYNLAEPVALRGGFAGGLSARRLQAARKAMQAQGIQCVFKEPQLSSRPLRALVEDSDAVVAVADPLGTNIPPGKEHYFTMMRQLAKSFADCLK